MKILKRLVIGILAVVAFWFVAIYGIIVVIAWLSRRTTEA
jgi:hypothetical protein